MPIEEICYNLFAKLDTMKSIDRQKEILGKILKLIILIGIISIFFGSTYSKEFVCFAFGA